MIVHHGITIIKLKLFIHCIMNQRAFLSILQIFLVPLTVKTAMYWGIFRWKKYTVSVLTCFLVAGSPLIQFGFIGMPVFIGWIIGVGIGVYVLTKYSAVELFPAGIASVIGVEIFFACAERFVIAPLLY